MAIVGGLDVHRRQITYDFVDTETGQVARGRIVPATREELRRWLERFHSRTGAFALEATTGWRFVAEEIERAGLVPHLAEPADTRALRGPKKRAKTDAADAAHLRDLLITGRVPESWIPPTAILDLRTQVRLYKALVDDRTAWVQRLRAELFHQGLPKRPLLTEEGRAWLEGVAVPHASRVAIHTGLSMIDHINAQLQPIKTDLGNFSRRQPGCKALQAHFGIGPLTSVAILAELGDARRFSSSRLAVRYAGLDVTVHESDAKRAPGHLSRQGPEVLRWAVYEAAQAACRRGSPDFAYYRAVKARIDHNRACLAIARKILRWAYHTLRCLGDDALAPPPDPTVKRAA